MTESNLSRAGEGRPGYTFRQATRGIEVAVTPLFIPEQSNPSENLYVWSYEIEIVNGIAGARLARYGYAD